MSLTDSTSLGEDGKFKFKHPSSFANLYNIRAGSTVFDLIAKNGDDITFSTNLTDTAHNYTITGSEDSEKIKEFNKIDNVFNGQIGKVNRAISRRGAKK